MLKAVLEFEKPEMKMPQQYKEYRTQLERGKDKTYVIKNHDGSHVAHYKAKGEKVSESSLEAGPYHPTPRSSDSDSSSSSATSNNNDDWSSSPLNPLHPMSPLSPFNPMNW